MEKIIFTEKGIFKRSFESHSDMVKELLDMGPLKMPVKDFQEYKSELENQIINTWSQLTAAMELQFTDKVKELQETLDAQKKQLEEILK